MHLSMYDYLVDQIPDQVVYFSEKSNELLKPLLADEQANSMTKL